MSEDEDSSPPTASTPHRTLDTASAQNDPDQSYTECDTPDVPEGVSYFDNAGMTVLTHAVASAGRNAVTYKPHPWNKPPSNLTDDVAEVRRLFSRLVDGSGDGSDIAIVPSTSFALTMAARNLERTGRVRENSRILLVQDQMSSAVYCWQDVTTRVRGAELEVVPYPKDESGWTDPILERIESEDFDVSVACLPQVHWSDGSLIDLERIGRACRRRNAALVIDGTQSAGVMPLDVAAIDPDCVAASVHKWLLASHGMSLVYIAPRNHGTWLPLDQHERARLGEDSPLWDALANKLRGGCCGKGGYPEPFMPGARRCDSGGRPNPIIVPMVRAGLSIVMRYDLEAVQKKLMEITSSILEGALKLGFIVTPGPRCGHIIGLRPGRELGEKLTPERMVEIAKKLEEKEIFIAVRSGAFRISPYLDTTDHDVNNLLDGLRDEIGA